MACERITFPDGSAGHLCGEAAVDDAPACSVCGSPGAEYLCDGPALAGSERVTCDAPLCGRCTSQTEPLLTIPTDPAVRTVMRLAAGNFTGPGGPTSAPERAYWRLVLDAPRAEPHDYCPRCAPRASEG